jgi:glycosyltransferase involved in cell wall biosynthesis
MTIRSTEKLIFFTHSFPYGIGEQWKLNDICAWATHFDKIIVVPLCYENGILNRYRYPANVQIDPPLVPLAGFPRERALRVFIDVLARRDPLELRELIGQITSLRLNRLRELIGAIGTANYVLRECLARGYLGRDSNKTTFYFFWALGAATMIPFLKMHVGGIIVGFHGYDLYREISRYGYFPFRKEMIERADVLAPCSTHGAQYLKTIYPHVANKIVVKRLGVADKGVSGSSRDGSLRIVTCAFVSHGKRLHLVADSLARCRSKIEWVHIGGGKELEELKSYAKAQLLGKDIDVRFLGTLKPDEVIQFYASNPVDLFMSLSVSEGVPVSIMEALSMGIPVLATDVGGVSELIDGRVGYLIGSNVEPHAVANIIDDFRSLPPAEIDSLRQAARLRWKERCKSPEINESFVHSIVGRIGS